MTETEPRGMSPLMRDQVALALATTSAWFTAIAYWSFGVPKFVVWYGVCVSAASSALAVCLDRRRDGTRWWFWPAYVVAVTVASAWYLHVRGPIVAVELVLPTLAVLLVLSPLRQLRWADAGGAPRRPAPAANRGRRRRSLRRNPGLARDRACRVCSQESPPSLFSAALRSPGRQRASRILRRPRHRP